MSSSTRLLALMGAHTKGDAAFLRAALSACVLSPCSRVPGSCKWRAWEPCPELWRMMPCWLPYGIGHLISSIPLSTKLSNTLSIWEEKLLRQSPWLLPQLISIDIGSNDTHGFLCNRPYQLSLTFATWVRRSIPRNAFLRSSPKQDSLMVYVPYTEFSSCRMKDIRRPALPWRAQTPKRFIAVRLATLMSHICRRTLPSYCMLSELPLNTNVALLVLPCPGWVRN